ncbi:TetR/AcrR family transcriptional regulator [Beijerinckia indica]|uniref:Transcriptional regulator, TetR family n=1 Tax=Beijerinckia indica subsp. indica (strain ATCC 9039 / DSM 1715 / NCIMB 8712) TaxID=395963 RepID=B2IC25_BEII9|nr:helix-turn-helix domain-containing protein [Beijerinckia indica]ACB95280.1 transcriptional regulator, TetR family [Beijerinckia indica subsp. indica ATCC 9039]
MQHDTSRYKDILSAAESLFRYKGYHATSMSDVAEICHVQKPALYHHFSSKEELALAVMAEVQTYFDSSVFVYAYDDALLPEIQLLNMNKMIERYYSVGSGGCLFANFTIEQIDSIPAFVVPIRYYFESWSNAYIAIFSKAYGFEEAESLAGGFVSDLQGALIMIRVTQDSEHLLRIFRRLTQKLHTGPLLEK